MINLEQAYACFPEELKQRAQWCIAAPDKSPYSVNRQTGQWFRAKVTEPKSWLAFSEALAIAQLYGLRVGYVLSADDPYAVIDIDVKNAVNEPDPLKWTSPEQMQSYDKIRKRAESYTERSLSGQGLHIFVQATVGKGKRFGGVEIYDRERFIICTGDNITSSVVAPRQEMIEEMVAVIDAQQSRRGGDKEFAQWAMQKYELEEGEEMHSDSEIFEMGCAADNGVKFRMLCDGDWEHLGYPSQSEADSALINMFAFYSNHNEQVRRLFRMSALGKRDKAKRNQYLNDTIALYRVDQEIKFRQHQETAALLAPQIRAMEERLAAVEKTGDHFAVAETNPIPDGASVVPASTELPWPPGLMGKLAQYIAASSYLSVPEYAIATSLAMLAGICGKAWEVNGTGLNLYVVAVGESGTGKESSHEAISRFNSMLSNRCPHSLDFFEFANMASGQALLKKVGEAQCFLLVYGEWGKTLRMMNEQSNAGLQSLRQKLLDLYQKNTTSSIVGGNRRSNKEDSIASINGVALSFLGETNPKDFYAAVSAGEMGDGFLSRFTVIEYTGLRVKGNKERAIHANPPDWMMTWLEALVNTSTNYVNANKQVNVAIRADAMEDLDRYEEYARIQINALENRERDDSRQLWNRAHLKVLKMSALMAVADNMTLPVITPEHVAWAVALVNKDVAAFQYKEKSGEIGNGDLACTSRLLVICGQYLKEKPAPGYKVPEQLWAANIVTRKYLQNRTSQNSQFAKARNGAVAALEKAIQNMMANGQLEPLPMASIKELVGHGVGQCYRIVNVG